MMNDPEFRFMHPLYAAWRQRGNLRHHLFAVVLLLFCILFIIWASLMCLDEITRCDGKVVASGHLQIIDSPEPGIISAILVKEGDVVEHGQVLMQLHNATVAAELAETETRYYSRMAAAARLKAEIEETEIDMPAEVLSNKPQAAIDELRLFKARHQLEKAQEEIMQQQISQKQHEFNESSARHEQLNKNKLLLARELQMTAPLLKEKLVPLTDYLRQRREYEDVTGQIKSLESTMPKIKSGVLEGQQRLEEVKAKRIAEAVQELRNLQAELAELSKRLIEKRDRVQRNELKSPVKGVVKVIKNTTIGGAVRADEDLMEIVPLEDKMIIEGYVKPSDIAFVQVGMPAVIKVSAYDFSIYGALEGVVETISADTFTPEQNNSAAGNNSFYKVKIATKKTFLEYQDKELPIISGMLVTVDIVTGKKSVMSYILKPILKAQTAAFRER